MHGSHTLPHTSHSTYTYQVGFCNFPSINSITLLVAAILLASTATSIHFLGGKTIATALCATSATGVLVTDVAISSIKITALAEQSAEPVYVAGSLPRSASASDIDALRGELKGGNGHISSGASSPAVMVDSSGSSPVLVSSGTHSGPSGSDSGSGSHHRSPASSFVRVNNADAAASSSSGPSGSDSESGGKSPGSSSFVMIRKPGSGSDSDSPVVVTPPLSPPLSPHLTIINQPHIHQHVMHIHITPDAAVAAGLVGGGGGGARGPQTTIAGTVAASALLAPIVATADATAATGLFGGGGGASTSALLVAPAAAAAPPSTQTAHIQTLDEAAFNAAQQGLHSELAQLISENSDLLKAINEETGNSLLHVAAMNENTECVTTLLGSGIDTALRDKGGKTAFQLAVAGGHGEVAALIKEHDIAKIVKACDDRNIGGVTRSLSLLAQYKWVISEGSKETILHHIAQKGMPQHIGFYSQVVAACSQLKMPMDLTDKDGKQASDVAKDEAVAEVLRKNELEFAYDKNDTNAITKIFTHAKAKELAAKTDARGKTMLHKAVEDAPKAANNNTAFHVIELYALKFSDLLEQRDQSGYNALHYAATLGTTAVAKQLVAKKKDEQRISYLNSLSASGKTALHYAANAGHTDFVLWCLGNGADATIKDKSQKNYLVDAQSRVKRAVQQRDQTQAAAASLPRDGRNPAKPA